MGQVRHGCATTTHAMRAAIQRSQASIAALSRLYGINPKTVMKWRKRSSVEDRATGPKDPRSTVLTAAEEAIVVAFRRHTLLPLDDCLWSLQATIPHLTRSSPHRCLQRHGISRLPEADGDRPAKKTFKPYTIGFFHLDQFWPSCAPAKASSISSSRSTAPPSSPSPDWPRAPMPKPLSSSSKPCWPPCPTGSTPS